MRELKDDLTCDGAGFMRNLLHDGLVRTKKFQRMGKKSIFTPAFSTDLVNPWYSHFGDAI